jgi:hypothetical protein
VTTINENLYGELFLLQGIENSKDKDKPALISGKTVMRLQAESKTINEGGNEGKVTEWKLVEYKEIPNLK